MRGVFRTTGPVIIYSSSGTGAWEAALVNTLSPGDRVVAFESGHFAAAWAKVARNLCLNVELIQGDWRRAADPDVLAEILSKDSGYEIKAVMAVHNETSSGVVSDIVSIRKAIDASGHPALLMVDTVSCLGPWITAMMSGALTSNRQRFAVEVPDVAVWPGLQRTQ